jgi:hypothetical protein
MQRGRTGGAKDRPADFRATLQATAGKATGWYLGIVDLVAYLLSRGDRNHKMFK